MSPQKIVKKREIGKIPLYTLPYAMHTVFRLMRVFWAKLTVYCGVHKLPNISTALTFRILLSDPQTFFYSSLSDFIDNSI